MQVIKTIMEKNPISISSGNPVKTEPITPLGTNPPSVQQTISSHFPPTEDKRINSLFLRLAAIYGHLWRTLYKTEEFLKCTKLEWQGALQLFADETLDKALLHCREREAYPPSLPMFVEICKSLVVRPQYSSVNEPQTNTDPEIARTYLEKIRNILIIKPPRGTISCQE